MVNFFIARRYLFSKNTRNAVNFISLISLLGFVIGTFSLVVILSVFNGFEKVINQLYNTYDPDIKITSSHGKFFSSDEKLQSTLLSKKDIVSFSYVLEENGYMPDKSSSPLSSMGGGFTEEILMPTHEFTIQQELDGRTLIVPLSVMQNLVKEENAYSALEIRLKPGVEAQQLISQLKSELGDSYILKDRYEQHELLNKIMKSEKNVSFILLSFILLIVSFNLTAGLVMLVLEKKENIKTLKAMGGSNQLIRNIFLTEGFLICVIGSTIGIFLGFLICQLQITYGFIPIGNANTLVISSYPVAMKLFDFILVAMVSIITCILCSYFPARKASLIEPSE
ncbi:MAG: ABC transporter permease [Bacteroidetes bacterium]|nr:ABC transporter permease [Bacteroidota bacterium]